MTDVRHAKCPLYKYSRPLRDEEADWSWTQTAHQPIWIQHYKRISVLVLPNTFIKSSVQLKPVCISLNRFDLCIKSTKLIIMHEHTSSLNSHLSLIFVRIITLSENLSLVQTLFVTNECLSYVFHLIIDYINWMNMCLCVRVFVYSLFHACISVSQELVNVSYLCLNAAWSNTIYVTHI